MNEYDKVRYGWDAGKSFGHIPMPIPNNKESLWYTGEYNVQPILRDCSIFEADKWIKIKPGDKETFPKQDNAKNARSVSVHAYDADCNCKVIAFYDHYRDKWYEDDGESHPLHDHIKNITY